MGGRPDSVGATFGLMPSTVPILSTGSRQDDLDRLESERFDVVIVGGGITGAGVARDAAHRGLRVALVEAVDFAAGTSSRSSKLIHGGLRYLAQGDVGLVRETALERKAVHRMAPHLAEPCWMVVAARNRASLLKFRTGIGTYEKLGAVDDVDRHRVWDRDDIIDHEPLLRIDDYPWVCAYREYLSDDARLVLAVLRDAVDHGAVVTNHLPATDLIRNSNRIEGVEARCGVSGRDVIITGDVVVNAAGPWVETLAGWEHGSPTNRLHLSKGVHIVVPRSRLGVNNLIVLTTADKRSIFAIPKDDVVIIGTTDTSYHGNRTRWPEINAEDVDYLLKPLTRLLDVEPLTFDNVLAAWSGLRPLIAQHGKEAKEMSRKEEVWIGPGGMVTVAGGKLTGFRAMSITVMEAVAEQLDRPLPEPPEPDPVPGAQFEPMADGGRIDLDREADRLNDQTGCGSAAARRLIRLYGSDALAVLDLGSETLAGDSERADSDGGGGQTSLVCAGEIHWAVDVEAAATLEDVLYRRTRAAWYRPQERERLVEPAATVMAAKLGWNAERISAEVEHVKARYADELTFRTTARNDGMGGSL